MESSKDYNWRARAACWGEDPELFFPLGYSQATLDQIEAAKAICMRCPVIESCLDFAMRNDIRDGIWGGMSEDDRRAAKRRQRRLNEVNTAESCQIQG